jgi:heme exporter protein D
MDRLTDFLAMGGYAVFVWPAFALTAVVMIGLLVSTLRRLRANERLLAQMQAAAPRRGAPR